MARTFRHPVGISLVTRLLASLVSPMLWIVAQGADTSMQLDLSGVYESLPAGRVLPSGNRNIGSPADVELLPYALGRRSGTGEQEEDAFKLCQAIGPFRMMAMERTKIELVP